MRNAHWSRSSVSSLATSSGVRASTTLTPRRGKLIGRVLDQSSVKRPRSHNRVGIAKPVVALFEHAGELVACKASARTKCCVDRILRKLDANSRSEIAVWAVREGLAAMDAIREHHADYFVRFAAPIALRAFDADPSLDALEQAAPPVLYSPFCSPGQGMAATLLEAHADFNREFRGDAVEPSRFELMEQLPSLAGKASIRAAHAAAALP